MGYKRRKERAARHHAGDFNEQKALHRRHVSASQVRQSFNCRIYYKMPESDCVRVAWVGGSTDMIHRVVGLKRRHPLAMILMVKNSPCHRWKKPESAIGIRKRLKLERAERMSRTDPWFEE